jgi:hypothetical protein
MRTAPALVLAAAAAATVAASAAGAISQGERPVDEVRGCGTRGDGNAPQKLPVGGVRIGPLVIWPSVRTRVERATNGSWAYYVKAPVVLPARTKVVLSVAPQARHLVGFQSRTRTTEGVTAIRFEACKESEPSFPRAYRGTVGKYTGFPFGFWLARRSACIPLEVWIDGRAEPIRRLVPFGRRSC